MSVITVSSICSVTLIGMLFCLRISIACRISSRVCALIHSVARQMRSISSCETSFLPRTLSSLSLMLHLTVESVMFSVGVVIRSSIRRRHRKRRRSSDPPCCRQLRNSGARRNSLPLRPSAARAHPIDRGISD